MKITWVPDISKIISLFILRHFHLTVGADILFWSLKEPFLVVSVPFLRSHPPTSGELNKKKETLRRKSHR